MKNSLFNRFVFVACLAFEVNARDLTVVGFVNKADGLGQIIPGLIDALCNDIDIDFVSTRPLFNNFENVSKAVRYVCNRKVNNKSNVVLYCDSLCYDGNNLVKNLPDGDIKIALSMFESTRIPNCWVDVLNNKFDLVIVPDIFLFNAYKESGVVIPIFVLPLGMDLNKFFLAEKSIRPHVPFTFGCSAAFVSHKNLERLILAFKEAFGDSDAVRLRIQGRLSDRNYFRVLKNCAIGCRNIELVERILGEQAYIDFLRSLDCYVLLSKGEGFSFTPRQALAMGCPCILANNTAQKTICSSGLVYAVDSEIIETACYRIYSFLGPVGNAFNCLPKDVVTALKTVYGQYDKFLQKAAGGSAWVKQYDWNILRQRYLALIKPAFVSEGSRNECYENRFVCDSQKLVKRYKNVFKI